MYLTNWRSYWAAGTEAIFRQNSCETSTMRMRFAFGLSYQDICLWRIANRTKILNSMGQLLQYNIADHTGWCSKRGYRARIFKLLKSPRIDSKKSIPPAGRYDNPIPTRFLAPIDCLKIPALGFECQTLKNPLQIIRCKEYISRWGYLLKVCSHERFVGGGIYRIFLYGILHLPLHAGLVGLNLYCIYNTHCVSRRFIPGFQV